MKILKIVLSIPKLILCLALSALKLLFYSAGEIALSIPIIYGYEIGNVLLVFVFGFILVMFNGAILSLADDRRKRRTKYEDLFTNPNRAVTI